MTEDLDSGFEVVWMELGRFWWAWWASSEWLVPY